MANIFFTADLHIGHVNVVKWRKEFSHVEEHDEFIINNWNNTVSKRDIIYVLGDVAFNRFGTEKLRRLKGIKHLILGNHDRYLRDFHINFFNRINGAQSFKTDFLLTHVPVHNSSIKPRFKYNIHGHTHYQGAPSEEHICVCLEQTEWKPKPFDEILKEYK